MLEKKASRSLLPWQGLPKEDVCKVRLWLIHSLCPLMCPALGGIQLRTAEQGQPDVPMWHDNVRAGTRVQLCQKVMCQVIVPLRGWSAARVIGSCYEEILNSMKFIPATQPPPWCLLPFLPTLWAVLPPAVRAQRSLEGMGHGSACQQCCNLSAFIWDSILIAHFFH